MGNAQQHLLSATRGAAEGARRRSTLTAASEQASTAATSTIRKASPPGQLSPAPSPVQKIPYALSSTPTANFRVFSGTRESGWRAATPTAATTSAARIAAAAASAVRPPGAPM